MNGNGGTYFDVSLGTAGAISGDVDTGVSFDGDDHIEVGHSNDFMVDEGTFQFWFNTPGITQKGSLFSKDATGFGTGGHASPYLESSEIVVRLQSATTSFYVRTDVTTQTISENDWHHVAFTFGAGGMNLFMDGKQVATNAYSGGLATSSGGAVNAEILVIGASNQLSTSGTTDGVTDFFVGDIDDFAVIGSQLGLENIRSLYFSGEGGYVVSENTTLNVTAAEGVLANDIDYDGDPFTAVLVIGPSNANSFTLNANGSFTYTPTADYNGTDTFTYYADDGGASNTVTVTILVTGDNDAPVNTVPGTQTVVEETTTGIGGISITDVDAGTSNLTSRLQVSNGVLNVTLSGSANISSGANGSGDLTIQGSVTDINATLASLTYTEGADVVGTNADTLTITTNDLGNTGSGGAKQDIDNVRIDITTVNDAPINTVPGTQTVAEETTTGIGGISITDVDAGTSNLTSRLQVGNGVLNVTLSGSATISTGANGTGDLTIQGSVTDINATLVSLTYTGGADVVGTNADTLTITTNDLGNTGSGGARQDVDNIQIDITGVNDAPVITSNGSGANANVSVVEGTTSVTTVTATDVDIPADTLTYSISGGSDFGHFNIGSLSGQLSFNSVPNFATPTDSDFNNIYEVEVTLLDGRGGSDTQLIQVTVQDTNNAPAIVSDGGGSSATIELDENVSTVTQVVAVDVDLPADTLSFSIIGGADAASFAIDSAGNLTFVTAPDFETLSDSNLDGVFEVLVQVSDGEGGTDDQSLIVTIQDSLEAPPPEPSVDETLPEVEEATDDPAEPVAEAATAEAQASSNSAFVGKSDSTVRSSDRTIEELVPQIQPTIIPAPANHTAHGVNSQGSRWDTPFRNVTSESWETTMISDSTVTDTVLTAGKVSFTLPDHKGQNDSFNWGDGVAAQQLAFSSMALVSSSLSVGYVLWLLRGGSLLVTAMSSVPAWRSFDPLPIIESFEDAGAGGFDDLGETLDSLAAGEAHHTSA